MKLVNMLLADYANVTSDNKLNVMGVFTTIHAASYPARHPTLFLVIQLLPELGELDQDKELRIRLVDSDDQGSLSLSVPVRIVKNEVGDRPGTNALIRLDDIVFPSADSYRFVAEMDGEPIGEAPLTTLVSP